MPTTFYFKGICIPNLQLNSFRFIIHYSKIKMAIYNGLTSNENEGRTFQAFAMKCKNIMLDFILPKRYKSSHEKQNANFIHMDTCMVPLSSIQVFLHIWILLKSFDSSSWPRDQENMSLQDQLNGLIRPSREDTIRNKILLALGATTTHQMKLEYLMDLPLELMPKVLYLVQQPPAHSSSLKNVYHVMEDCVVPLLST